MDKEKESVAEKLRYKIKMGYRPTYDLESAEDHGINWLVLTKEEFDRIVAEAIRETKRPSSKTHPL